ncbi:MAG: ATP-grasp domain-containing protein [Rivularia sp. (in: cyanobacteria)]|jgi:carbamoyl-phosphate synthase large subunit
MNIILTCAGRRNYIVKYFQEVLNDRGMVFACDVSTEAAALQEADKSFVLPSVDSEDYIDKLLYLCKNNDIRLLISLHDLELPILALQRDRFAEVGTILAVSSPEVINICFDKWETFKFLTSHNIPTAKTYLSLSEAQQAIATGELKYPVVVKPRWGTASIGIHYPGDDEELELAYRYVNKLLTKTFLSNISASEPDKCVIIQEKLIGQEYGLDIVNDLQGSYQSTLVKRKLKMRAGETDRATTVFSKKLEELGQNIGQKLGHIANLDCDVMMNDSGYAVLEMNPRFGGGYPFSHYAGANLPAALIAWSNKEKINREWLNVQHNIASSKCDRLVGVEFK